jgi:hypothetical protein
VVLMVWRHGADSAVLLVGKKAPGTRSYGPTVESAAPPGLNRRRRMRGTSKQAIELPWETWRDVIAVLREKALPSVPEHAIVIEEQLERHGPDEPIVRLSLTDDVFLRSYNWARLQLGIPLPVE